MADIRKLAEVPTEDDDALAELKKAILDRQAKVDSVLEENKKDTANPLAQIGLGLAGGLAEGLTGRKGLSQVGLDGYNAGFDQRRKQRMTALESDKDSMKGLLDIARLRMTDRKKSVDDERSERSLTERERHNRAMEKAYGVKDETKRGEKNEALMTLYGMARTPDDAKQLKSASELKESFDRKIGEMISLRKKHNGGAFFNREDVDRGKQLSKDLLLAYKDMAKLGVLSVSDEKILNAIIPSDPLEYNVSGAVGQDPTMHRLKMFKQDVNKDFGSRIANRIRGAPTLPVVAEDEEDKSPATGGGVVPSANAGSGLTQEQELRRQELLKKAGQK